MKEDPQFTGFIIEIAALRESVAAKDQEIKEAESAYQRLCDSLETVGIERDEWKARAEAAEADTRRLNRIEVANVNKALFILGYGWATKGVRHAADYLLCHPAISAQESPK